MIFTEFMNKDYKTAAKDGEKALNFIPNNKNLLKLCLQYIWRTMNLKRHRYL